jgi:hypothetical protein
MTMGYRVLFVAPPGRDRGVDVIVYKDPVGTMAPESGSKSRTGRRKFRFVYEVLSRRMRGTS